MKALVTATVPSMIGQFNMQNIEILQDLGYEVEVACNFNDYSVWSKEKIDSLKEKLKNMGISTIQIDFERSVGKVVHSLKAYYQMKKLLKENKYTIIHTHTPISSFITRMAYRASIQNNQCRMIYTAHGFHFFKGNNKITNFLFKNLERYAAKFTDVLITINLEDYIAAKCFKLKELGTVEYIPGIGIDLNYISQISGNRNELLSNLKIGFDSILMLSVGEINKNKNHEIVIKALAELPLNYHFIICGVGNKEIELINLAKKLKVDGRIHLLGYRNDIIKIMKSCDIFIFPSFREGLSVALMEALSCNLKVVASNIRGNCDLVKNDINGFLFNPKLKDDLIKAVIKINSLNDISNDMKKYSKEYIAELLKKIYSR